MNFLAAEIIPLDLTSQQKKRFFAELRHYFLEDPILYRHCVDQMIRRCIPENEMRLSFSIVILWSVVDILVDKGQLQRCCNHVLFGLPYSRMLTLS